MVDSAYLLAPQIVSVRFDVAPAFNAMESIRELNEVERLSGFGDWVTQTAASLPQERLDTNRLIFDTCETLFFELMPVMSAQTDFPGYIAQIASRDPRELRDAMLAIYPHWLTHEPKLWSADQGELSAQRLLDDEEAFVSFMGATCEATVYNDTLLRRAYALFNDPARLQMTIVEHLRWMWDHVVEQEWQRVQPMLHESAAAFERLDFSNMTIYEAARLVTTRDLRGIDQKGKLENVDAVVFIPAPHIGPYVLPVKLETTAYILFGARLPRGAQIASSALSRSELLTRLNALADDTRLRILELLTRSEELCAQDIIEELDLSQSSISRHLSQLSANGFITERRREVAKCYSLNTDRVIDTLRTLTTFLSRQ